jgi:hypothetical protein
MSPREVLQRIIGVLNATGVPYMLTGSLASAYHGLPRATQDIDLVIAPSEGQLRELVARFRMPDHYVDEQTAVEAYRHESQFNVLDLSTGWKIDFIIRRSRPFSRTEFERRTVVDFEGMPIAIARAEDVILAKLEWARTGESERQVEDAAGILRVRAGELDLQYLDRWARELQLEAQWEAARRRSGA